MSFSVPGNFFCKFKTGDNIQYNLTCLTYLYEVYEAASPANKSKLIKPIVLIEVSIIEAILHDFHFRIKANIYEGVAGIAVTVADYMRGKKIDEFGDYIDSAKKHDFFSEADSNFYDRLSELRKIRNRVHIQNTKKYKPVNEISVYTEGVKRSSERCLEKVVKTISRNHPRPEPLGDYVGNLTFPWNEHFD